MVKESACQCRRLKRCGFDPGSERSPGVGHGTPLQCSCLEYWAWRATVHGIAKSRTRLITHSPKIHCLPGSQLAPHSRAVVFICPLHINQGKLNSPEPGFHGALAALQDSIIGELSHCLKLKIGHRQYSWNLSRSRIVSVYFYLLFSLIENFRQCESVAQVMVRWGVDLSQVSPVASRLRVETGVFIAKRAAHSLLQAILPWIPFK